MDRVEADGLLSGQAEIWRYMFGFAESMALKCAVELRLPDIINSHGQPITLSQIASRIDPPCTPDVGCLARVMRMLVRKRIFTADHPSDGGETLYGMTHSAKWLLRDSELSLAPMLLMENHPWLLAPWHSLSQCVKEGGYAFDKAHGVDLWSLASQNPELNDLFNEGLASTSRVITQAFLSGYKDGLDSVRSLIDVGGGTGGLIATIVKSHPHIKGVNFDLPHVIATAPPVDGVSHVGGDMFKGIPTADAVLMKWILHDWGDEACVKILKNCRKAIPEKTGKVILVEIILQEDGKSPFGDMDLAFDLLMIAHTSGGKERTEQEWSKLLQAGGFPRYNIVKIPALPSIIEAYPI